MDVDIKTQQCIVMINDSTMLSWAAIELDLDPLVINFDKVLRVRGKAIFNTCRKTKYMSIQVTKSNRNMNANTFLSISDFGPQNGVSLTLGLGLDESQ